MKIRFSLNSQFKKSILDLFIVIIGVSVAFFVNNANEKNKEAKERRKVIASLQAELKFMSERFPSMAEWQSKMNISWDSLHQLGQISDFNYYYYLQPQHNYSVLEYAIDARNVNVVDFELHQKLVILYKHIKMLEEAEIYMTSIALDYVAEENPSQTASPQNLFLFKRFIGFAKNRAKQLQYLSIEANETLKLITK